MGGGKEKEPRKEQPSSKARIIAVEYRGQAGGATSLQPVLIGDNYNQELYQLVNKEIVNTKEKLERVLAGKLDNPELSRAKHPRPGVIERSSRELKQIGRMQAPLFEERLRILSGEMPGKITIYQTPDGDVSRVEVSRLNEQETRVWQPINIASRKIKSEEALSLIVEAFVQLSQKRNGHESVRAELGTDLKDRYINFLKRNEELEPVMGNAFRAMREFL